MKRKSLHDQWLAERAVFPAGEDYFMFARRAARGFIFGRDGERGGAAWHLVREARELVRATIAPQSRWVDSGKTTPSGKTICRCTLCGAEDPAAGRCRAGCTDERAAWGWLP